MEELNSEIDLDKLNDICYDFMHDHVGYLSVDNCNFLMDNTYYLQKLLGYNPSLPHQWKGRPYEDLLCEYLIKVRNENSIIVEKLRHLIPKWSEQELNPNEWASMNWNGYQY